MDSNQLRTLSVDALTGYWPPHLGVKTDAEKIEYLAQRIDEAADEIQAIEDAQERC